MTRQFERVPSSVRSDWSFRYSLLPGRNEVRRGRTRRHAGLGPVHPTGPGPALADPYLMKVSVVLLLLPETRDRLLRSWANYRMSIGRTSQRSSSLPTTSTTLIDAVVRELTQWTGQV